MEFNPDFFKEEVRSDFLVTEKMKKIWAVELNLLVEFDKVCKKNNLKWFVDYGTLLGAARHQGFIPWDDDIDVSMFRDDYMKLLAIAPDEFKEPYFFQSAYTDEKVWPFSKLRDSRTTAIEIPEMKKMNQGIFIDIFPLDDVPANKDNSAVFRIQTELWFTIMAPHIIVRGLNEPKYPFVLDRDIILDLLQNYDDTQKLAEFEKFNLSHFGEADHVNFLAEEISKVSPSKSKECYREIIYLPFGNITVPAPKGYEEILSVQYGDWHKFVQGTSFHEGIFFDPDNPYTRYMAQ